MSKTENIISQAGDNGWNFFDQLMSGPNGGRQSALSPEQLAKAQKLAHTWAAFYATEHGREAIEYLHEVTFLRATFTAMLGLDMASAYGHGVFREGQNAIVFMIDKMIAEGRKDEQPKERTAT